MCAVVYAALFKFCRESEGVSVTLEAWVFSSVCQAAIRGAAVEARGD